MRQDDIDKRELTSEANAPEPPEHKNQLVLGRGKVFVNQRYVGNTPHAEIVHLPDGLIFVFITQDISDENLDMLTDWPAKVVVDFKAVNPFGRNMNYRGTGQFREGRLSLKTDDWQGIRFVVECDKFERAVSSRPAARLE